VLWILLPTLPAAGLIALYRTFIWRTDAPEPQPVGLSWLANGALANVLFFPGTFLAVATVYGVGGVPVDSRVAVELAIGVSLCALLLIATHWSCSRWWVRRARVKRLT
jgi:hypothetical protein